MVVPARSPRTNHSHAGRPRRREGGGIRRPPGGRWSTWPGGSPSSAWTQASLFYDEIAGSSPYPKGPALPVHATRQRHRKRLAWWPPHPRRVLTRIGLETSCTRPTTRVNADGPGKCQTSRPASRPRPRAERDPKSSRAVRVAGTDLSRETSPSKVLRSRPGSSCCSAVSVRGAWLYFRLGERVRRAPGIEPNHDRVSPNS